MSNPDIRFIKNKDIDYQKWDHCLARSSVALVYAQSWYLDLISPGWDALIAEDYEFVMPLTTKQKLGISFLLQPIYAQQQGIFPETDQVTQNAFLALLRDQFKYINIQLNASHCEPFPEDFLVYTRENFILDLSLSIAGLRSNYSKHTRRQIRKAQENKVSVIKGLQTSEYFGLKTSAAKSKPLEQTMQTLKRVMDYGYTQGNAMGYGAYNEQNTLCAAALFIYWDQRVTYLNAVSNDEGKNINAMHLIVDQFIEEHSGSPLTLDFEGSVIPGIARFYKGFGAQTEQYHCLKSNRLPLPLRWIIK